MSSSLAPPKAKRQQSAELGTSLFVRAISIDDNDNDFDENNNVNQGDYYNNYDEDEYYDVDEYYEEEDYFDEYDDYADNYTGSGYRGGSGGGGGGGARVYTFNII
tara:strand:+ start:375 stop:689 length:315 start_codon:yes stop_codon:yes gene_type:complete